jgi:hypothetical protein
MGTTRRGRSLVALIVTVGALILAIAPSARADSVLILDETVTGGASSIEGAKAASLGYTVDVVNAAQWSTKTAADFASYRAIILGDPTCQGPNAGLAAATANTNTWGPEVDGNVIVIGTDPVFHAGQGGRELTEKGVEFAAFEAGKTGAYITLSCYYHGTTANTPVPLLDGISPGGFTVTGVGCFNDAHITATHPALTGLTDADLSNWSCSVHEAFDNWPDTGPASERFEVLAIAEGFGGAYNAPDGTVGTPYIVARGATVISDIKLTPENATNNVGTTHTVTATVTTNDPSPGTPVVGTTVTFTVTSGPNAGTTGTGVTNSSGEATFSYSSSSVGLDTIEATFVDSLSRTQRSNAVAKEWVKPPNENPDCSTVTANPKILWPPNHKYQLITLSGATDPDGDPVTLTITGVTQDEPLNGLGDGDTSPDAKSGPSSNKVYVRAERAGTRNGRVYRISFTGSDGKGGTCSGAATVGVPHDQGRGKVPIDSGQSVNSFGP